MLIIKLFVGIGIVSICSYLGILKSKSFENRVQDLKNIQTSLNIFKNKIEFTYEPIKDIFEEISNMVYENKDNIFKKTNFFMRTNPVSESWYKSIEEVLTYLNTEDKESIKTMGNLLGKTDKTGQISEINMTQSLIERQIEKAEIEKNKNSKLYQKLGMIIGIGIVIVLI